MRKINSQTEFNNFKKNFISEKENKMASDYAFLKSISLGIITQYFEMLNIFLEKNKCKINSFISNAKNYLNNGFFSQIKFIIAIPKLIKFHGNKYDINYVFLKANFSKFEDQKIANE